LLPDDEAGQFRILLTFSLPSIYPITDEHVSGIPHAEQVRRLVSGGARLIQIREKHADSGYFYRAVVESVDIAHAAGVKIIVNDRVDIALTAGADGVHLGQDDVPPEMARRVLGKNAIVGFSTHRPEEASDAVGLPVDYIAIGPIFATTTKDDPDPILGLKLLASAKAAVGDLPLVAIGGINLRNVGSVLDNGADSAAMISGLLSDSLEIIDRMRGLSSLSLSGR